MAPLEEEVRLLKENLQKVFDEREQFRRQATEASSRGGSLTKDLEDVLSETQGLSTQMGAMCYYLCFIRLGHSGCGSVFCLIIF